MVRTQIQLTRKLAMQVKELSDQERISMAEIIRRALTHFFETTLQAGTDERYQRAMEAAGRCSSGHRQLSTKHDSAFTEAAGQ
jgi:hypothetical protein